MGHLKKRMCMLHISIFIFSVCKSFFVCICFDVKHTELYWKQNVQHTSSCLNLLICWVHYLSWDKHSLYLSIVVFCGFSTHSNDRICSPR